MSVGVNPIEATNLDTDSKKPLNPNCNRGFDSLHRFGGVVKWQGGSLKNGSNPLYLVFKL